MRTEALKLYRSKLTAYEQTEILDYPEIYFLGLEAKKVEGVPGGASNNGYDDESGSYIKVRALSLSLAFSPPPLPPPPPPLALTSWQI